MQVTRVRRWSGAEESVTTSVLLSVVLVGVFVWTAPTVIEVTGEPRPSTGPTFPNPQPPAPSPIPSPPPSPAPAPLPTPGSPP